jgi:hypothetical protein
MFMIKDKIMLEEKFLHQYFISHKFASFKRQLHIYGFKKVYPHNLFLPSDIRDLQSSPGIAVYQHTSFQRGKKRRYSILYLVGEAQKNSRVQYQLLPPHQQGKRKKERRWLMQWMIALHTVSSKA